MSVLTLTHIGGPTTLLEVEGWRILTDPTFDAPGRTYRFGWGTSSRKLTGPAIPAADIGPIDAVLLTHDHHADNLDDAGRLLLPAAGAVVTTASGANRLGRGTVGLRPWDTTLLRAAGRPDITVTATPARHGPAGSRPVVGDVVGFALTWPGQEHGALWISGDTVLYDPLRTLPQRVAVGTAVLHLGRVGFPLTGPLAYTMSGADAVELVRLLRIPTVVPVHYEGWSHFRQGRASVLAALAEAPDVASRFRWTAAGEPLSLVV
ncbi:MBL fold metallo-hydrolase [Promicromonospora thailandica]|uniref:L-ascorbate metabolism protein UlaG, beta-lactamase superfamily n=1 Tax=Promicromonospora thailandica TaxID=765201 RepID=A0A9X2JXR0_9MICO|nr:MBL fold metallo-hydrolase [Promicromonospora thailandica]MCP2264394.1 L-ascorbate metabolism protein UlaG, beta-lactamase superfamily [Promicromonospora thailandica]BFF20911.1 MBL fold metallo-hydrolase [Promicromonospora thailandica]